MIDLEGQKKPSEHVAPGSVQPFGKGPHGELIERITMANGGTSVSILTWGASVQDVRLEKHPHSLVLGSQDFASYLTKMRYFGAIVGPVANRIGGGRFTIDGANFDLERNENNRTTLHGGTAGTGQRNWTILASEATSCTLSVLHPDGDGGFPGNVTVQAKYSLDDYGSLSIEITANSDRTTHLNFAHHGYWNLDGSQNISKHWLQICGDSYLPVDANLIPVGGPEPVAGTELDYRELKQIATPQHMAIDHNFCIDPSVTDVKAICRVSAGNLQLDVLSTEPGLQVFDATGMETSPFVGHQGRCYGHHAGLALEPQKWPDSPNRPGYPSTLVRAGETYRQLTQLKFKVLP